ncbi:MAG: hypothetical protein PHG66_03385 [Candidatus Colwellbacteria bacterium]|nr:hypothetical protein [Candidatus Colwellbacteria bacterium]
MSTNQTSFSSEETSLIEKVERAVRSSIKTDFEILKNGRVERSFTSHLARAIQDEISEHNIYGDPFYNKHLGAAKYLNGKIIELDVAVHERNVDTNNLVAIELETNNHPEGNDIWKIEGLTHNLGGYGYKIGLYLVVGVSERAGEIITMDWYKSGSKVKI